MIRHLLFIVCFLCILPLASIGNTIHTDSLLRLLQLQKSNFEKANTYIAIAESYLNVDIDTALYYTDLGLGYCDKKTDFVELISFYQIQGVANFKKSLYQKSFDNYEEMNRAAIRIDDLNAQRIALNGMGLSMLYIGRFNYSLYYLQMADSLTSNEEVLKKAKVKLDIASVCMQLNNFSKALGNSLFSVENYEQAADSFNLVYAYNTLGSIYSKLDKDSMAVINFKKALRFNAAVQIPNIDIQIYSNYGLSYLGQKNTQDSSLKYFNKALALCSNEDYDNRLAIMINIATVYYNQNRITESIEAYKQCLNVPIIIQRPYFLQAIYVNLGQSFFAANQLDSAYSYSEKGVKVSVETGELNFKMMGLKQLMKIDSLNENFPQLCIHQRAYFEAQIELIEKHSADKSRGILANLELQERELDNTRLKEQALHQKEVLERKSKYNLIISVISVLLIGLVGLLFFLRRRTQLLNQQLSATNQIIENQKIQLLKANESKDMFFNIVAHDLKNPFNSLIGVLQELETNFNTISEEEKKHLIGLLLNASIHAHQFVANLLEWGLSQSGHMQVDLKLVSAKSIINSCVAIHQEQYLLKEVDLQIALSEEDVVFADYNMLHTILRNFINNAIKYTTKGGQIIIKTEAIRNYLRIQVEDDGLGIKAEDVELIFSIVSKLKTDGTAAEKGSGLGLKIVSEFAQKMNAKTGVQSVYGGGSKFWIDVPLNK